METIDWLPAHPISYDKAQQFERTNEHVNECWPLLGRYPDPFDSVILLSICLTPDERLWAAFDPDEAAWVVLVRGTDPFMLRLVATIATEARAYAEQFYDDATFAAFSKGSVADASVE